MLLASKAASTATASVKWSNGKTSILTTLKLTYAGSIGAQTITRQDHRRHKTPFVGKTTKLVSQFVPIGAVASQGQGAPQDRDCVAQEGHEEHARLSPTCDLGEAPSPRRWGLPVCRVRRGP